MRLLYTCCLLTKYESIETRMSMLHSGITINISVTRTPFLDYVLKYIGRILCGRSQCIYFICKSVYVLNSATLSKRVSYKLPGMRSKIDDKLLPFRIYKGNVRCINDERNGVF